MLVRFYAEDLVNRFEYKLDIAVRQKKCETTVCSPLASLARLNAKIQY